MKRILIISTFLVLAISASAQNEKYITAMEQRLKGFDTVRSSEGLIELSNAFERIAEAEKTQWLPYYYAALTQVNLGYNIAMGGGSLGGFASKTDPLADKAELLLDKAEQLQKDNSEIWVVRKMIATLRMMGDVMSRYMTYGPVAAEALNTAKKLNPENPRVFMLEGLDQFNTPEQYGGSKARAKTILEEAVKKI